MSITKKFLIAPYTTGMETNVKPFLLPDDAWAFLDNVHLYEGRIEKRYGSRPMNQAVNDNVQQLYSRVGMNIGTTDGAGILPPTVVPGIIWKQGQLFGVGDVIFTSHQAAGAMYSTVAGQAGTYDTATGTVTINSPANPNTDVYFYPCEPIMGIWNYEQQNLNDEQTFAWDTQFCYQFTLGRWQRLLGDSIWTSNNAQFFWADNYRSIGQAYNNLYAVNFKDTDRLRYFDGVTLQWVTFGNNLLLDAAGTYLMTAAIVFGYKGRLLLLNTVENVGGNTQRFPNRIRWSDAGVIDITRQADCFNTANDLPSYLEIPISEAIVSVGMIKDKMVVYCERSTWLLAFTGNDQQPFIPSQINTELGVESQYSTVEFDRAVIGIGNVGVHACNGVNVERIDQKINLDVFKIRNADNGIIRVHGVRDYQRNLVFWTFPSMESVDIWPDRFFVYNYRAGSWSFYDDSVTAFGYFYLPQDLRWEEVDQEWREIDWSWQDATIQASDRIILSGNQQGYISMMVRNTRLANAFTIADIDFVDPETPLITSYNHNLKDGAFIFISDVVADDVDINDQIFQIIRADNDSFVITKLDGGSSNYQGGGTFSIVPRIDMMSKQYNFFQSDYRNVGISQVDFLIDRGDIDGVISVDYAVNTSQVSMVNNATASGAITGTNNLDLGPYTSVPFEAQQEQLWHTIYLQANGSYVQINIYFNDEQMLNPDCVFSPFTLYAMLFTAMPTSQRLF